jgi:hypothetical protein
MKKQINKLFKPFIIFSAILALPLSVLAQITVSAPPERVCSGSGLGTVICNLQQLLNSVVPLLIALGVVYFVFGVVQYVIAGGEEAKKKGRDHVIYGIIGLTIIVALWGVVGLVVSTFNLGGQGFKTPSLAPQAIDSNCDIGNNPKLSNLLGYATCLINNSLIPLMFALAVVYFIWGVIQFVILGAGEEAKRTQGRQHMIWGVIALAVMLGVWALVGILGGTFGIDTNVLPQVKP